MFFIQSFVVLYIYIYIYIYICCHPQTDCFVVSQLIKMARRIGRFKLGLKPAQLYIRLSIIPLSQQSTYDSLGIRHRVVDFGCLHFALLDNRVLHSCEKLCITRVTAFNIFARVLSCVYIDIHIQTVSLYHNLSVWLVTQDASSWDGNPPLSHQSTYFRKSI